MTQFPARRASLWLALGATLLLGAFLRFYQLGYKSLWVDEILQVLVARNGMVGVLRNAQRHVLGAPPLDYLVTALVRTLGENEFILRFPPVAWGILAIALGFVLARRLTRSHSIALVTAVLVAAAPLVVRFAQEVRFYSLPICLSVLMVYLFVRAWQESSPVHWLLFSLAMLAALFAHYYALFIVIALVVTAFLDTLPFFHDRPRDLRHAGLGLIASLIPPTAILLFWFTSHGFTGQAAFGFTPPTFDDVLVEPIFGPSVEFPEQRTLLFLVGAVIFPLLALWSVIMSLREQRVWGLLLGSIVALGVGGVLVADWRAAYFYTSRQLLFVVPFYLLLVAAGLDGIMRAVLRRPLFAAAGTAIAVVLLLGLFSFSLRASYNAPKDDWRSAARFLLQNINSHANTIVSTPYGLEQYLFYYEPSLEEHFVLQKELTTEDATSRVWFVTWGDRQAPRTPNELTAADGWHSIQLAVSPNVRLAYLGAASQNDLRRELAALDLPPQVVIYSNFLEQLQALDSNLAQQVAQTSVDALQTTRPPLLDAQLTRFWRKITRLP
ncbi:MAG TPA: glycosyltransferase family 39 protein [Anaerolineae bacterium]|nr:glycosyltransferase family 39 protein [Anaerolineae bacterium]